MSFEKGGNIMDIKGWTRKEIKISDLILDSLNPRFLGKFNKRTSQNTLIQEIVLGKYGAMKLANEILEKQDFPPLERMIIIQEDGKNIVLEGNRRLAAYKCLIDPRLAPSPQQKKFMKLSHNIHFDSDRLIEVLITPTRKDAAPILEAKHVITTVQKWSTAVKDSFARKLRKSSQGLKGSDRKRIFRANFYKLLKEIVLSSENSKIVNDHHKFHLTTLHRVVESEPGKKFLNYEIKDDGRISFLDSKRELLNKLKRIVEDIAVENVTSRKSAKNADEIKKYLTGISEEIIQKGRPGEAVDKGAGGEAAEGATPLVLLPAKRARAFTQEEALNYIIFICERFSRAVRVLTDRHAGRETIVIKDEYDVQDVIHLCLKLFFDQVYPEEWTPSYLSGSSRADFLMKEHKIFLEVKKTRKGLGDKELAEQLIIDTHHYNESKDCEILVCFVYDPEKKLTDTARIIADLERKTFKSLRVRCCIEH